MENQKEYKLEKEIDFEMSLLVLVNEALSRKNSAQDPETARQWAIVRTELEKVRAIVKTYLRSSNVD